jgi:ArsR family transcriptional regulator, arsenate/arsenite/antimonite-responsive transcriptional repressor
MSVDKIFEALSSAPRRRILAYLSKTDMTAGEIAQRFADIMSQPAISKHLSILENAGLIWREKRGMNVHYGLKEDALTGRPQSGNRSRASPRNDRARLARDT